MTLGMRASIKAPLLGRFVSGQPEGESMFKKMIFGGAIALSAVHSAQAEEAFFEPQYEAEVFYSNLTIKDDVITGLGLPKPKGDGGGVRLSALLNQTFQVAGEFSTSRPDSSFADGVYHFDFTQARLGIRAVKAAVNGSPVYAAAGLEYGHFVTDAEVDYTVASGLTDMKFDSTRYDLAIGHLRTGYRTKAAHLYLDAAYGYGSDQSLREFLGGASFNVVNNLNLFGEYRFSQFKESGSKTNFDDIRVGIGATF